jgi:two-component system, OmpR family, response regulator
MEAFDGSRETNADVVRVLLVASDDLLSADALLDLAMRGFSVTPVSDGASAIKLLRDRPVDLVVLDLVLPDVDGIAFLAAIRAARPRLPVIALTALEDERSRLDGFARGADDCVTKPLSVPELMARMEARLRWRDLSDTLVTAGPLSLDISSNRASIGDRDVALSPRERSLLAAFLRHAGEVLSRGELLRLVWELDFDPNSNVVDVYVAALRRKLGQQVIETIRGRGYRLRVSALN